MDPSSALLLFMLFQATEKVIGYAGGKIADAMSKPVWGVLEDKARCLTTIFIRVNGFIMLANSPKLDVFLPITATTN